MDDRKNSVTSTEETAGKSRRKLRMILLSVLTMTFMMTLDSSILNVALPTLAEDLNVPTSQIDWTSIAYLISLCSFVLMFGKIADIVGRAKVFQAGTLIFTVGSLLCSISGSFVFLIVSRLIQGVGASAAMSSNLGIITEAYPVTKRAKALSSVSSSVALGMLVGPIAGGFILNYFSWQVIFLINLPIGVFAFILGMFFLPKSSGNKAIERFDVGGGVFIVLAIAAVISALTMLQTYRDFYLYILLFAGFVFFGVFIAAERRAKSPLVKVSLFRNRRFVVNLITIGISFISVGTYNIMLPFYLQNALGYSPGTAGLILAAQPVIIAIAAPIAGTLADKVGYRPVSATGMFVFGCGALFMGLQYSLTSGVFLIVLGILIFAGGNALAQSPNNALVMSSVPPEDYGFAGSIGTLVRYLGASIGLTLSTGVLYSLMSREAGFVVTTFLDDRPEIFVHGLRYVFFGICAILWLASFLMLRAHLKEKREETASV